MIKTLDEQQQNVAKRLNDVSKDGGALFRYPQREQWDKNAMSTLQRDDMDVEPKLSRAVFDASNMNRSRQQEIARREQREYTDLMKRIAFGEDEGYFTNEHSSLKACTHAFQHLVKQQAPSYLPDVGFDPDEKNVVTSTRMRVRIPPTLVHGIGEHPVMYYTDPNGYLCRVDNVTVRTFKTIVGIKHRESGIPGLDNPKAKDDSPPNALPSTIVKRPKYNGNCSEVQLFNARQTGINLTSGTHPTVSVTQKFIRCKGPSAAITRLVWTAGKGSYAYQISNKIKFDDWQKEKDTLKRFLASSENASSLTVFSMKGKALQELEKMTTDLVQYLTNTVKPKPQFATMVCDFIKDQAGVWWYIQTKAFKLVKEGASHPLSTTADHTPQSINNTQNTTISNLNTSTALSTSKKKKGSVLKMLNCAICGQSYKPADLQYSLTLKMIYATERHLKKHGEYREWFDRQEFRVAENPLWYQPKRVCKSCFDMYIHEQKLEQAELLFAKAIGIPIDSNQMEISNVLAAYNRRRNQLKAQTGAKTFDASSYSTVTPDTPTKAGPRSPASVSKVKVPRCAYLGIRTPQIQHCTTKMRMYRLVMFFYEIHNIPETIEGPLYLKLDFLYTTLKLPIHIHESDKRNNAVPLNKLRVFHFFTNMWDEGAASVEGTPSKPGSPTTSSPGGHRPSPGGSTQQPTFGSPHGNGAAAQNTTDSKPTAPCNPHLKAFMQAQGELVIHLWQPNTSSLGQCRLPLSQFEGGLIEKLDYVRLFSTSYSQLCSLRVTMGIIKGRDMAVDDIALRQHPTGVWVPSEDFFCVDALPDEWMQLVIGPQQDTETVGSAGKYVLAADAMLTETHESKVEEILMSSPGGVKGAKGGKTQKKQQRALKETFEGWKASWAGEERLGKKHHGAMTKRKGRVGGSGLLRGGTRSTLQTKFKGSPTHMEAASSHDSPLFVQRVRNVGLKIRDNDHSPNRSANTTSHSITGGGGYSGTDHTRKKGSADNLRNIVNANKQEDETEKEGINRTQSVRTNESHEQGEGINKSDNGSIQKGGGGTSSQQIQQGSGSNANQLATGAGGVGGGTGGLLSQQFAPLTAIVANGRNESSVADPVISETVLKRIGKIQPPFHVWCIQLHIQTITDLGSAVDESWVISYSLLGKDIIHESFQLFQTGPLVFDVEDFFYVYALEPSVFIRYLKSVNKIKIVLSRKYNFMIVKEAEVSLMQLINDANNGSSKEDWTGSSMHGLFPMSSRATLQIEKDDLSQHGSSTGVASYQSDDDLGSPVERRKKSKKKQKKRRSSTGSKNMRVFQLTNDEYDDNDDEELFFVESEAAARQDGASSGSDSEAGFSPSVSQAGKSKHHPDDGSDSSASQDSDSSDDQDESSKRPQLALVVKLSKMYTHKHLIPNACGCIHTDYGPLVLLNAA